MPYAGFSDWVKLYGQGGVGNVRFNVDQQAIC
jgi:hypothetical protein